MLLGGSAHRARPGSVAGSIGLPSAETHIRLGLAFQPTPYRIVSIEHYYLIDTYTPSIGQVPVNTANEVTPDVHLPLHPLEFQILLTLTEGPTHAYAVVCSIEKKQTTGKKILPTNMYRRIWRLVSNGLVEEIPGNVAAAVRPRKHLAITSLGRQVAAAETTRLRSLLLQAKEVGVRPEGGGGQ